MAKANAIDDVEFRDRLLHDVPYDSEIEALGTAFIAVVGGDTHSQDEESE